MILSLCMIVKADYREAKLLDRCLSSVTDVFDEICITITGKSPACERVAKKYGAKISHFEWVNDFSKARNFNFKQATGDFIMWLDCDDVVKGKLNIRASVEKLEELHLDLGIMEYLYDFDKYGRCTVKHLKTRIIRNDGCVEWVGELHEDFKQNRLVEQAMIDNVHVIHRTKHKRSEESVERNAKIAEQYLKDHPDDPRSLWLIANALMGKNEREKACEKFKQFIEASESDEEKYLAHLTISEIEEDTVHALKALELRPNYPNAYHKLGELWYKKGKKERALEFFEIGLQLPKPEFSIIVYNPRDYDYNPLMMMMRIYFEMGKHDKALAIVNTLLKNYPEDKSLQAKKKVLDKAFGELMRIDEILKQLEELDDDELKFTIEALPTKIQQHPKLCLYKNTRIIKKESSGKDLVFYCSYTSKEWNPEIADKEGIGGSEEAVIHLSKRLAKLGWNVTVYNNCGFQNKIYDGVQYRHWWEWNYRDKQDVVILWRHPKPLDYGINAKKVFVDLHDVIGDAEFTKERVKKMTGAFFKTEAHRNLFKSVPDEKAIIIPNGIDPELFKEKVEKNPYLILNTSSPDRHLEATLDIFEELIKREPKKPWKLAWYYGWGVYDTVHEKDKKMMDWKERQMDRFAELVSKGRAEGGFMIGHKEIAKKYLEAGVFLYPTQFFEIHCISAVKAQLAGCVCITSDFAALAETVRFGYTLHTEGEKWKKGESTFGDSGREDSYVPLIRRTIRKKEIDITMEKEWAENRYNWDRITDLWDKELSFTRQ